MGRDGKSSIIIVDDLQEELTPEKKNRLLYWFNVVMGSDMKPTTRREMNERPHPLDSQDFGSTGMEPVWYLAHPLAPDDRYTFQQNMDHVRHMIRVLFNCGVRCIAPYHTLCLALDDNDMEHRRIGLEIDCQVVRALQGRIILTGHVLSRGMLQEVRTAMSLHSSQIRNFIGWKDIQIATFYDMENEILKAIKLNDV